MLKSITSKPLMESELPSVQTASVAAKVTQEGASKGLSSAQPHNPRGSYGEIEGQAPTLPPAKALEALDRFRDQIDLVDATSSGPLGRLSANARGALGAITALDASAGPTATQAIAATYDATLEALGRLAELLAAPGTSKTVKGAGLRLQADLGRLAEACAAKGANAAPDIGRPASTLPRFEVQKYWDADSTPAALASLSRAVGSVAPKSGGRTPTIEAGIVMASLMHDVAYYYGGWSADRERADQLFGAQIPFFAGKLDPEAVSSAKVAAMVDVAAVRVGGGVPFHESYSWSYGFAPAQRGYATLNPGQSEQVQRIARGTFREVVGQIASGQFLLSDVLAAKLAKATPEYQAEVKASIVKLCQALQKDFENGAAGEIPGF